MTQLSDEVVERVARALYAFDYECRRPNFKKSDWDDEMSGEKEYQIAKAEAAIAAYEAKGDIPGLEG